MTKPTPEQSIEWLTDNAMFAVGYTIEASEHLHNVNEALSEMRRMQAWVRDSFCECHDEYGTPMAAPCDRCQVLGIDGREKSND